MGAEVESIVVGRRLRRSKRTHKQLRGSQLNFAIREKQGSTSNTAGNLAPGNAPTSINTFIHISTHQLTKHSSLYNYVTHTSPNKHKLHATHWFISNCRQVYARCTTIPAGQQVSKEQSITQKNLGEIQYSNRSTRAKKQPAQHNGTSAISTCYHTLRRWLTTTGSVCRLLQVNEGVDSLFWRGGLVTEP